jgi:hypothetical protein
MFSSLSSNLRSQISRANSVVFPIRNNIRNKNMNLFLNLSKKNFSSAYVNHRDTIDNNQNTPFDFSEENYKQVEEILVNTLKNILFIKKFKAEIIFKFYIRNGKY